MLLENYSQMNLTIIKNIYGYCKLQQLKAFLNIENQHFVNISVNIKLTKQLGVKNIKINAWYLVCDMSGRVVMNCITSTCYHISSTTYKHQEKAIVSGIRKQDTN